jgi:hypothetical protein
MKTKLELIPKDVAEINEAVAHANELLMRTMDLVPQTIRAMIVAGEKLKAKRDSCAQGEWYDWLAANVRDISRETARRWIRLAEFNQTHSGKLNDAASVRQAYQLAGLLPESESSSASGGKSSDRDAYLVYLLRSETYLSAQIAAQPIDQWPSDRRTELKQRLEPFVEIYQRLLTEP